MRTHVCTLACVHTLDACFYQVAWVDTRPPSSSAAFGPEPGPRRLTRGSWQQTRRRISSAQIRKEVAFRAACQHPGVSLRAGQARQATVSGPGSSTPAASSSAAHNSRCQAVWQEHQGWCCKSGPPRASVSCREPHRKAPAPRERNNCARKKGFSGNSAICSTFSIVPTGELGAQSKAGEHTDFYFSWRVNKWSFIFSLRPTTLKITSALLTGGCAPMAAV